MNLPAIPIALPSPRLHPLRAPQTHALPRTQAQPHLSPAVLAWRAAGAELMAIGGNDVVALVDLAAGRIVCKWCYSEGEDGREAVTDLEKAGNNRIHDFTVLPSPTQDTDSPDTTLTTHLFVCGSDATIRQFLIVVPHLAPTPFAPPPRVIRVRTFRTPAPAVSVAASPAALFAGCVDGAVWGFGVGDGPSSPVRLVGHADGKAVWDLWCGRVPVVAELPRLPRAGPQTAVGVAWRVFSAGFDRSVREWGAGKPEVGEKEREAVRWWGFGKGVNAVTVAVVRPARRSGGGVVPRASPPPPQSPLVALGPSSPRLTSVMATRLNLVSGWSMGSGGDASPRSPGAGSGWRAAWDVGDPMEEIARDRGHGLLVDDRVAERMLPPAAMAGGENERARGAVLASPMGSPGRRAGASPTTGIGMPKLIARRPSFEFERVAEGCDEDERWEVRVVAGLVNGDVEEVAVGVEGVGMAEGRMEEKRVVHKGHRSYVTSLHVVHGAECASQYRIVSGCEDGSVRVWKALSEEEGQVVHQQTVPGNEIYSLSVLSPAPASLEQEHKDVKKGASKRKQVFAAVPGGGGVVKEVLF
ncbi:hypothetical protein HDU96_002301 [Phlyctochytrium bullatum]|nr:hypothetical protein HDU96_002301 [Phlyctochytrium bullatum]